MEYNREDIMISLKRNSSLPQSARNASSHSITPFFFNLRSSAYS